MIFFLYAPRRQARRQQREELQQLLLQIRLATRSSESSFIARRKDRASSCRLDGYKHFASGHLIQFGIAPVGWRHIEFLFLVKGKRKIEQNFDLTTKEIIPRVWTESWKRKAKSSKWETVVHILRGEYTLLLLLSIDAGSFTPDVRIFGARAAPASSPIHRAGQNTMNTLVPASPDLA